MARGAGDDLCAVCGKARARRRCPALNEGVCAVCCATRLRGKIDGCDQRCPYWATHRAPRPDDPSRQQLLEALETALAHAERGERARVEEILGHASPVIDRWEDRELQANVALIRARLARAIRGTDGALAEIEAAVSRWPESFPLALEHAALLTMARRVGRAVIEARRAEALARDIDPVSRRAALVVLGHALLLSGEHKEAAEALGEAISLGEPNPKVFRDRARARLELGDFDGVIADIEHALEAGMNLEENAVLLAARAHEAAGRPLEAVAWIQRLRAGGSNVPGWCHPYAGHLLTAAGKFDAALRELTAEPEDQIPNWLEPAVVVDLALCLHGLGNWEQAIPALRRALERHPDRIDLEDKLMQSLLELDRIDEALRLYLDIQARQPALLMKGIGRRIGARLARAIAAREGMTSGENGEISGAVFITETDGIPAYHVYRSFKEIPQYFDDRYRAAFGVGVPVEHKVEFLLRLARKLRARGDHAGAADLLEEVVAELRAAKEIRTIWDEALMDVIERCSGLWSRLPRRYQQALLQNEANLAAARQVGSPDLTPFANEYFRILELLLDEKLVLPLHRLFPHLGLRPHNTCLTVTSLYFRMKQPAIRSAVGSILPLERVDEMTALLDGIRGLRVSTHGWVKHDIERLRAAILGNDRPGLLTLVLELGSQLADRGEASTRQ